MRIQDNAVFIMPILERLMQKEDTFSTRGMGEALQTLGFLARHQEDKSMVLGFIAGKLNHPKQTIQVAAMRALANLQDPSAVAILSNWTHGDPQDQRYKAATTAIENLKKQLAPPQTLQTLREQVQDLEKHYQKLHKELQQLNQQWESIEFPPSHSSSTENLVEETP
jgi:DNA repair exonuclease SbcCD ATPase subunit